MPMVIDGDRLVLRQVLMANDPIKGEVFEGDALTMFDGGVAAAVSGDRVIGQCSARGPNTAPIDFVIAGPCNFIADGAIAANKALVPSTTPGRVKASGNSPQDRAVVCGVSVEAATSAGQVFKGIRA
jgi:hypothetical protein